MGKFNGTMDNIRLSHHGEEILIESDTVDIAVLQYFGEEFREQIEANADLIVDAFRVRQQIDFDLTELLNQRNEMLEALKKFIEVSNEADMKPEDECIELHFLFQKIIKNSTEPCQK